MDKLSFYKEFPQTYEFFEDLKCPTLDDIIKHPNFIPTLTLPMWEEHFTFANQNIDKQSCGILKRKFREITDIENLKMFLLSYMLLVFYSKIGNINQLLNLLKKRRKIRMWEHLI